MTHGRSFFLVLSAYFSAGFASVSSMGGDSSPVIAKFVSVSMSGFQMPFAGLREFTEFVSGLAAR
jgi:hypothetical protein